MALRRTQAGHALVAERFGAPFAPLAPGAMADVVVREAAGVRHVLVGGRPVVVDGRLVGGDLEQIRSEAAAEADRLWRRMDALPEEA